MTTPTRVEPYYADDTVTLYHGDMREVLPLFTRAQQFACVIADPPYAETSLEWDRWPDGWPALIAEHASSMWCFGSMRMFLERRDEFVHMRGEDGRFVPGWKLSQDVVWEKHNGTGFAADRLKRVHELAVHWYRGNWSAIWHDAPREAYSGPDKHARARSSRTPHTGEIGGHVYVDDGTRLVRSVVRAPSVRGGVHPTEKPTGILDPLIRYACPPGGTVLDPFAGSGSTAVAARMSGRRAVLIEGHEPYCEAIANRLQQDVLPIGGTA